MKTIRILSLLLILLHPKQAFPYEKARFSLGEAINYALERHPKILIAKNKVAKQKEVLKSIRMFNPNVSIQGGYDFLKDREYVGISVSQSLESILNYRRDLNKAQFDLENFNHELELITQEVIEEVRNSHTDYRSKLKLLKTKLRFLSSYRKEFKLSAIKFKEGRISMDEYLSKKRLFEGATGEVNEANAGFEISKNRLYSAIGYMK